jgi:hypothetical protein
VRLSRKVVQKDCVCECAQVYIVILWNIKIFIFVVHLPTLFVCVDDIGCKWIVGSEIG